MYYRIDMKIIGAKWSWKLALLLRKEKLGLLKSLVMEAPKERLRHSIT
jgi:hypothetical protein